MLIILDRMLTIVYIMNTLVNERSKKCLGIK